MTRYKVLLEVHVDSDLTELQTIGLGTPIVSDPGTDIAEVQLHFSANPNRVFYNLLTPAIRSALESALADPDVSIPAFETGVVGAPAAD